MEMNDPLPRLLRLRGAIEGSMEAPETITPFSMSGLKASYVRLRPQVADVAESLGVESEEFDAMFPESVIVEEGRQRNDLVWAKSAAGLLQQLDRYLGALIEITVLKEQVPADSMSRARAAAQRGRAPQQ